MKRVSLSLILVLSLNVFAKEVVPAEEILSTLQVHQIFNEQYKTDLKGLIDFIDKEEKVAICVSEYVKKQTKTYSKFAQGNLYDLMHNFDRIASKIYGKKIPPDKISYEDKIEALGQIQCEMYYTMGIK